MKCPSQASSPRATSEPRSSNLADWRIDVAVSTEHAFLCLQASFPAAEATVLYDNMCFEHRRRMEFGSWGFFQKRFDGCKEGSFSTLFRIYMTAFTKTAGCLKGCEEERLRRDEDETYSP